MVLRLLFLSTCHGSAWKSSIRNYSYTVYRNLLKLHQRGILQTLNPEEKSPAFMKLLSAPQTVYCGFDPTGDSLHIGNLLAIMLLMHFQRAGHSPIALVGGATGHIGDPSGKTKDRDKMSKESIEHNVQCVSENLNRVFSNHQQHMWKDNTKSLPPLKVLNNKEFYVGKNVIDFLSTVGRFFRMGQMLNKKSVQSRLASPEGMNLTEFTYQIFQSYDWLHLLQNYNCKIQIGGNDQLGNIQSGLELISRTLKETVYGLTVPLVTSADGSKLGKTEKAGALWLSPEKTTPYEFYQYFINIADADVEEQLKLFTFYAEEDIQELVTKHMGDPSRRLAQQKLAEQVTILVHGTDGLSEAERWTQAFFSNKPESLLHLSEDELKKVFQNFPSAELLLEPDTTVLDMVLRSKAIENEAKAINIIQKGGVYINHRRVTSPDFVLIQGEHILPNQVTVLRTGKKNYKIIKWVS